MDTKQVSVFRVEFLRSAGNHVSFLIWSKFYKIFLWSDSKTVLSWTKNIKIKQDVHRKPNCWKKRTHKR